MLLGQNEQRRRQETGVLFSASAFLSPRPTPLSLIWSWCQEFDNDASGNLTYSS
jgi:hypothetical protein